MDDSQGSDFFSNSGDQRYDNSMMDVMNDTSYGCLFSRTKLSLAKNYNCSGDVSSLLEDCGDCITQSLDLVMQILVESDTHISKLQEYLEHAITILQMLSYYVKDIVESVALSCQTNKAFPTITGKIIMAVFTHCKDSEALYGNKLKMAEKQLKELFKSCHELQLTYLMVLEKHFLFDFMDGDQFCALLEALDINLRIGELVQSLDVKTMAEQWKGFTMLCEKYSTYLKDEQIFDKCAEVLCAMIKTNMNTALELNQEEKICLRSLKVANFAIKILMKICTVLKNGSNRNFVHIVELLVDIYLNNNIWQQSEESNQIAAAMTNNILATESLLNELLMETAFITIFTKYDLMMLKHEEKMLGYFLLLISVIKIAAVKEGFSFKRELIECVYTILPYGHIWFNIGLDFRVEYKNPESWGLYESFLSSNLALSLTLNSKEIIVLEQKMYEAIMNTDCMSALFSYNLWILLARYTTREYTMSQLIHLCKTYQRLETNKLFPKSPQQVHLTFLLSGLFKILPDCDRMKILKQFDFRKNDNLSLWCVLEVRNCPDLEVAAHFEKQLTLMLSEDSSNEELFALIKTMQVTSTCPKINDENLNEAIVNAWMGLCPKYNSFVTDIIYKETEWLYDYIDALIAVTVNLDCIGDAELAKIVHVVSELVSKCNLELKLILGMFTCKLPLFTNNGPNKQNIEKNLSTILKCLLHSEVLVRETFLNSLQHSSNSDQRIILEKLIRDDLSLQNIWESFNNCRTVDPAWKEELKTSWKYKYTHKCLENKVEDLSGSPENVVKTNSNNFEFADIDSLFEADSDQEPACKKFKLNSNDVEELLSRVESDVIQLCNVKENFSVIHRNRIRDICTKLSNIFE